MKKATLAVRVLTLCLFCFLFSGKAMAYSGAGAECYSPGSGSIGDLLITGGRQAVEDRLRVDYKKALERKRRIFNSTPLPDWAIFKSEQERFEVALRSFRGCSGTGMIDYAIASGDEEKFEYVMKAGVPINILYSGYASVFARCDQVDYIAEKLSRSGENNPARRLALYKKLLNQGADINWTETPKNYSKQNLVQIKCKNPEALAYFFENGLDKDVLNEEIKSSSTIGEMAVVDAVQYSRTSSMGLLEVYSKAGVVLGKSGRHRLCAICGVFDRNSDGRCKYAQTIFKLPDSDFMWDLPQEKITPWQACGKLPIFSR